MAAELSDENGLNLQGNISPEMKILASMLGRERGDYTEISHRTDPQEVRHDVRMLSAISEYLDWKADVRPNTYLFQNVIIPGLAQRANQLEISFPLGFGDYRREDKEAGLDNDHQKREALAAEYLRAARELQARLMLGEKITEQEMFGGDVEMYMERAFVDLRKLKLGSENYAIILNLPETYPGFERFGTKVEQAINLWKNVAEGNAEVDVVLKKPDGQTKTERRRLPNPFAQPRNEGLMELIMDKYIIPNMGAKNPLPHDGGSDPDKVLAVQKLERSDNLAAAVEGLLLVQHWDLDTKWGISSAGYKHAPTNEDVRQFSLDLNWKDDGKVAYPEMRRQSEWSGLGVDKETGQPKERRHHPRSVGSPATLGCYPILTDSAVDIISFDVLADGTFVNEKTKKAEEGRKKLTISVAEATWPQETEVKVEDGREVVYGKITRLIKPEEAKEAYPVTYEYKRLGLGEIPWDDIRVFDAGGDVLDILATSGPAAASELLGYTGIRSVAFEVPYKLQGYYAHKDTYSQFTRTDYLKQYEEVVKGDRLIKMNKGIDLALGIMASGQNLDDETVTSLSDYMRTVFLGGLGTSIVRRGPHGVKVAYNLEQRAQVPFNTTIDKGTVVNDLTDACRVSQFLPVIEEEGKPLKLDTRCDKLFKHIIDNGKAPTPFELKALGFDGWFSDAQLEKVRPLYPLIPIPKEEKR
jgi:hypothetical protein